MFQFPGIMFQAEGASNERLINGLNSAMNAIKKLNLISVPAKNNIQL